LKNLYESFLHTKPKNRVDGSILLIFTIPFFFAEMLKKLSLLIQEIYYQSEERLIK